MMSQAEKNGRQEIEILLPWHATGRLNRRDAERVEAALSADEDLALRYRLVREELAETIHFVETLGAPSPQAMERVMATIAVEPAGDERVRKRLGFLSAIAERLIPRTLALVAALACLAVLIEAGVITALRFERGSAGNYQTASVPQSADAGRSLLVGFAPDATAADVTRFLERFRVSVIDGPRAGGLYKLKFEASDLTAEDRDRIVERMRRETDIVRFAAPAE